MASNEGFQSQYTHKIGTIHSSASFSPFKWRGANIYAEFNPQMSVVREITLEKFLDEVNRAQYTFHIWTKYSKLKIIWNLSSLVHIIEPDYPRADSVRGCSINGLIQTTRNDRWSTDYPQLVRWNVPIFKKICLRMVWSYNVYLA